VYQHVGIKTGKVLVVFNYARRHETVQYGWSFAASGAAPNQTS